MQAGGTKSRRKALVEERKAESGQVSLAGHAENNVF